MALHVEHVVIGIGRLGPRHAQNVHVACCSRALMAEFTLRSASLLSRGVTSSPACRCPSGDGSVRSGPDPGSARGRPEGWMGGPGVTGSG